MIISWIYSRHLSRDRDDKKTIARFKNAGFKYLIIDMKTPTIDKTPGKTLTAKYKALLEFLMRNPTHFKAYIDSRINAVIFIQVL